MEFDSYLTAAIASQGPTQVGPFFLTPRNPMPRGSDTTGQGWAHTRNLSFRIQVLRQKIHQIERTPTVDHFVDQIALAAWQLLDHVLRRGPDSFVGPMDTCREQQHERGVSKVHGKTQKIGTVVYRLFSFSYQPQQNDV